MDPRNEMFCFVPVSVMWGGSSPALFVGSAVDLDGGAADLDTPGVAFGLPLTVDGALSLSGEFPCPVVCSTGWQK